jgi:hypothetical protein
MRFCWKGLGSAAGLVILSGSALAQRPAYQPSPSPAPATAAPVRTSSPAPAPVEVHVDQRCRILPSSPALPNGKKARPTTDWNTCHLEGVFDTQHEVQTVVGTELQRSDVEICEQQYVLGNQSAQPEVFIIGQPALKGWTIEGDPPPFQVADGMEYYRAWVQPGETVRLHVGMRKVTPRKPKALKVAVRNTGPAPNVPPLAGSIHAPESGDASTPPGLPDSF